MQEFAPDFGPEIAPETVAGGETISPGRRVAAELLSAPEGADFDLGALLAHLKAARAAVPLIVDLLDVSQIATSDAARLVVAIRHAAHGGRRVVVMVGDPRFESVLALVGIPGVVVCHTLEQAEQVLG